MSRWQYQIVNLGTFNTQERMAKSFGHLGSEGWELVALHDKASNWLTGIEKGFAVFKKEVGDGDPEPAVWASWEYANYVGIPLDERVGPHGERLRLTAPCKGDKHHKCQGYLCSCLCHSTSAAEPRLD